ncbi:MAG: EamA family transporter [Candidatus Micrarchaeota archaeon]
MNAFFNALTEFAQQNWLTLALLAMFFVSLTNLSLKILVKNQAVLKINWIALVPVALLVLIALTAGFLFFVNEAAFKITSAQLFWIAAVVVFSFATFACTLLALQSGKVALVSAVLSLSTVLVAIISVVFFGERFQPKEVAALVFALISILLLVL